MLKQKNMLHIPVESLLTLSERWLNPFLAAILNIALSACTFLRSLLASSFQWGGRSCWDKEDYQATRGLLMTFRSSGRDTVISSAVNLWPRVRYRRWAAAPSPLPPSQFPAVGFTHPSYEGWNDPNRPTNKWMPHPGAPAPKRPRIVELDVDTADKLSELVAATAVVDLSPAGDATAVIEEAPNGGGDLAPPPRRKSFSKLRRRLSQTFRFSLNGSLAELSGGFERPERSSNGKKSSSSN